MVGLGIRRGTSLRSWAAEGKGGMWYLHVRLDTLHHIEGSSIYTLLLNTPDLLNSFCFDLFLLKPFAA